MDPASQELIKQVSTYSYLGIFGISFLANVVVPVPEEVVILIIGYVAGLGKINFWITLAIVILGTFISDLGMFWLSRTNNRIVVGFYHRVFSKIFPVDHEFLSRHVTKVIFFARFLVQLRFLGPFIAGQVKTPWKTFMMIDGLAVVIYTSVLMWAGHYFEHRLGDLFSGVNQAKNIVIIIAGILILWSVGKLIRNFFMRIMKKDSDEKDL